MSQKGELSRRAKPILWLALAILVLCSVAQAATLDRPVRIAILGDRTGDHQEGIYGRVLQEVESMRPDFVMTVGDQIEGYVDDSAKVMAMWDGYDSLISVLTMPIHFTPGNHDIWSDNAEPWFRARRGEPYYSFDRQGLHIVVLDVGRWEASDQLPQEQIDWLKNDLEQATDAAYTLVFFHKPFWHDSVARGKDDILHDIFVANGVDAVFCGHYHEYYAGTIDGIMYTDIGSSGASYGPSAAGLGYHFGWVTIGNDGIHVVPITLDGVKPWQQASIADKSAFDRLIHYGLGMAGPIIVDPGTPLQDAIFKVAVDNTLASDALNDTLRWDIPEGWEINPPLAPVSVDAGDKTTVAFAASCHDNFFPVPSANLNFAFKDGIPAPAKANLEICRQAKCVPTSAAPQIDADLSESCWQQPVGDLLIGEGSERASEPVQFYFSYDADNLYLGVRCTDSKVDSITSTATKRDGAVWSNDCVGYFLSPNGRSGPAYQIYFNPDGVPFDQVLASDVDGWVTGDPSWNGEFEVATQLTSDGWALEARIPVKQFGVSLKSGDSWRVNFRRKQPRVGNSDWQTPIDYDPRSFGMLVFQ